MAKKFFYNRVYNTKRTIINIIIIGVCIIGVIVCFIITSNFEGENHNTPEGSLSIKKETTIEVNENYSNELFFSKIENVEIDDIKVTYPENFDVSKPGKYEVILEISGKNYESILNIVDTTKPILETKEVTISANETYKVSDFVKSCTDNSNKDCIIDFYTEGVNEDGMAIDYSKYKNSGTYAIKISAKDGSENQTVQETKLTITKSSSGETPSSKPVLCKYGNNIYDTNNYLVAIDITTNKCAVSLDLYKDTSMTSEINKLMDSETTKIKKDVEALNLTGTLALNRKVTAVINTKGDGIVGYELRMTVSITNNDKTETVVDYKVDSNGKRVFITNPYKLTS